MEILQKYKKVLSVLGSILLIVVVYKFTLPAEASGEISVELNGTAVVASTIKVHVAGAVVHEGVVELEAGARVEDAIQMAGGLTEDANVACVNFAKVVEDGQKITIMHNRSDEVATEDDAVPTYQNRDYSLLEKLNYMTAEEFQDVPGIGEKTSLKIVEARDAAGQFSEPEALKSVSGIGDAKYEQIIDFLEQ
ncbi:MAG: helix-hairpin-helix domain-containing protein [Clostridia bacterium]|nr:helix-hairpin-helix domain-containing protein [Clostridia bacterium]